tara:strand:- start:108 stop:1130 length:1023 start_codon:yes stop_codon:yes gene_type:complete
MTKAAELAKMGEVLTNSQIGGRRNIVYNGSAIVAQRGTSSTGLGGSAGVFVCDRWRGGFTMNSGRYTMTQDSNAPAGFSKSVKIDVTTAESSLNAASTMALGMIMEGQDLQQLKKGTSSAESVTFSFYVKSTTTGTYFLEFFDYTNGRLLNKSYTINSANTWEYKTITYEGDTTGTLNNDNLISLLINFCLASGTNRSSGTLGTTWAAHVDANRFVGQTNLFASTSNDWAITGLQMELGSQATPFEHRSFGEELALCQRYFIEDATVYRAYVNAPADTGSRGCNFYFPTTMRAAPSMTAAVDAGSATFSSRTTNGVGITVGGSVSGNTTFTSGYTADSEL